MTAGDVFNGEIVLTNHGLVRVDGLGIEMPPDSAFYAHETDAVIPESLAAGRVVYTEFQNSKIARDLDLNYLFGKAANKARSKLINSVILC